MQIGNVFRIEVPNINGEHRAIILYKNEEEVVFTMMTSKVQKRVNFLKHADHSETYIQKTLIIIEPNEYQSKQNHNLCSLTCKTAINTNNIKSYRPDAIISKTPCDTLPKDLLKKVYNGIQVSIYTDKEVKETVQQEYRKHHT